MARMQTSFVGGRPVGQPAGCTNATRNPLIMARVLTKALTIETGGIGNTSRAWSGPSARVPKVGSCMAWVVGEGDWYSCSLNQGLQLFLPSYSQPPSFKDRDLSLSRTQYSKETRFVIFKV